MKKITIRQSWVEYAKRQYSGGSYNANTIESKGRGQYAGTLGECAVGRYFIDAGIEFNYVARDNYDYDFDVVRRGDYSTKIDVKSKNSHGVPQPHYTVRVPESQAEQGCDIYIFTYVNDSHVYLLGWQTKQEFRELATFAPAGQVNDGHTEKVDCRFMPISELRDIDDLELLLIEY